LITLYSCPDPSWKVQQITSGAKEFLLCGMSSGAALKQIAKKIEMPQVLVFDALAPSEHVSDAHESFSKFWFANYDGPFVFLAPILDASDEKRSFFLKSRHNKQGDEPEFYSEIYAGNGKKTMSFGLIHAGTSDSFHKLVESVGKLDKNKNVKFTDLRKVTIRGATRNQGDDYKPETFELDAYDQKPGVEQFYSQRAIGLQTVFQLALKDTKKALTASSISAAAKAAIKSMGKGAVEESFHEMGEGALYVALMSNAQVAVTWDGAGSVNVNIFTYDETVDHKKVFVSKFKASLPSMSLVLKDEFPRGYGKVITKSDRVNRDESPSCYDHFKLCAMLYKAGDCDGEEKDWMNVHCSFSCGVCEKNDTRDEL
jgi:hypothetical protein